MKVVVFLGHSDLSGVTTFTYSWVKALKERKPNTQIDICCPTASSSLFLAHLLRYSELVDISEIKPDYYDYAFFNYNNVEIELGKTSKRFFVHGLHTAEFMPSDNTYDRVFVFSERAMLYLSHIRNRRLIRNAIDVSRFGFLPPSRIEKFLIHDSRNSTFSLHTILSAAKRFNGYISTLGADEFGSGKLWETEKILADADVVFAYGRSAIESMAMGKPTIIFGINGGDGLVTLSNFDKLAETNFSGWSLRKLPPSYECTPELIANEIKKIDFGELGAIRERIEKHFDIQHYLSKIFE